MNLEPEQLNSALIGFFGTIISIVATVVGYFIKRVMNNLDDRFKVIEQKLESQAEVNSKQTTDIINLTHSAKLSERAEQTMSSEIKELRTDIRKLSNTIMSNVIPNLRK